MQPGREGTGKAKIFRSRKRPPGTSSLLFAQEAEWFPNRELAVGGRTAGVEEGREPQTQVKRIVKVKTVNTARVL